VCGVRPGAENSRDEREGGSGQGGVVIGNAASGRRVCRRVGAAGRVGLVELRLG
jgi:hypothetical protein